ncbi:MULTISPECIES: LemA family protein [unclassified Myroides]|uniref:LemA family protein n=1 Tax=unclassified Myroides TaxID=2642485 RepID=UPI003D2F9484
MAIFIGIGILVLLVLWYIATNNRLVALKNNRENAFADIDVQLKQRHDLIPQLVSSVKGYMEHEAKTLEKLTQARTAAMQAGDINTKIQAEQQLSSALAGLRVAVEAYPDLKANTNFLQLQNEVSDIENKLAAVRRYFNSATKELNTAIESIPSNLVAGMKNMSRQPFFELAAEQRTQLDVAPEIKF